MNIRTQGRAAALISVLVWFATVAAQDLLPTAGRRSASPLAASGLGIDRGLRPGTALRAVGKPLSYARMRANERYLPGSLIVKFRSGTSASARDALLATVEGQTAPKVSNEPFNVVNLNDDADPEAVAQRLSMQPDVEYAQARYRVHPLFK